jgi:small GTP-binding protein
MSFEYNELLRIMNIYSKSTNDFWNSYKKNVDDSDNIILLVMDYVPILKPKVNIKIALIGVGGVGKTTFLKRLLNNSFNIQYRATTGYDITKIIRDNITYEFYDFAGQEIYSGVYNDPGFYGIFNLIFVMVDKNSRMSHKHGREWLRRINTHNIPTLKIRNKCEVGDGNFEFSNGDCYFNISTKTGQGVEEVLKQIVINY